MSDQLAAAAAAMGLPEALVQRSAEARSEETGASVEDILAQWAAGETAPVAAAPQAPPVEEAAEPDEALPEEATTTPEIVIEVPDQAETPTPAPQPIAVGPYKPPVLVGHEDSPMTLLAGVVGLFIIVMMVGLVGPSIPVDEPGARSSEIAFSEAALAGREVYAVSGCAACHTQMVRPVVADVGLGAVTLNDTNQILGTRRFGPDLSDVGSRVGSDQMQAIVAGQGTHPTHNLSPTELESLIAYLSESRTSSGPAPS
jgi:mono/diheme cytochrome c family protein